MIAIEASAALPPCKQLVAVLSHVFLQGDILPFYLLRPLFVVMPGMRANQHCHGPRSDLLSSVDDNTQEVRTWAMSRLRHEAAQIPAGVGRKLGKALRAKSLALFARRAWLLVSGCVCVGCVCLPLFVCVCVAGRFFACVCVGVQLSASVCLPVVICYFTLLFGCAFFPMSLHQCMRARVLCVAHLSHLSVCIHSPVRRPPN